MKENYDYFNANDHNSIKRNTCYNSTVIIYIFGHNSSFSSVGCILLFVEQRIVILLTAGTFAIWFPFVYHKPLSTKHGAVHVCSLTKKFLETNHCAFNQMFLLHY